MPNFFTAISIVLFIAFVIGMFKPERVIRWGQRRTRKQVLTVYGIAMLASVFVVGITAPKKSATETMPGQTANSPALDQKGADTNQPAKAASPINTESQVKPNQADAGDARQASSLPTAPRIETPLEKYKDYIARLGKWTPEVIALNENARKSASKNHDPSDFYRDVKKTITALEKKAQACPRNPDESTQLLFDATHSAVHKSIKAWEAMLAYLESSNVKDMAEFKDQQEKSSMSWEVATTEMGKLKKRIAEHEAQQKAGTK